MTIESVEKNKRIISEQDIPLISVIIPCYNEEAMIDLFMERLVAVLDAISVRFEVIFIDDGSRDSTVDRVTQHHERDPRIKLITLSRNFGKEIAMTAGIDFSSGEAVVVIDADLQDPPELISEMVRLWREGYDVVYATRTSREGESALKKFTAQCFYRLIRRMSKVNIPADTGDFRLMSRPVVNGLCRLREHHRFMKGLFSWVGFRQIGIPYHREPRHAGKTKFNYWKLWNFALEGITSFSYGPLKIASYFGAVVACFAFLYAVFLVVRVLILGIDVPGYPSIMVTILFFSGVQLITLGVIGEYLGRMFNEVKRRPLYLVENLLGVEPGLAYKIDRLDR